MSKVSGMYGESWQEALWSVPSMRQNSLQISTYHNNLAANSCAKALRWRRSCFLIHNLLLQIPQLPDSSLCEVKGVQDVQPPKGSDVIGYNIAISAIGAIGDIGDAGGSQRPAGKWQRWAVAISCLSAVHQLAIQSTVVSYGSAMTACRDSWMNCMFLLAEVGKSCGANIAVNNAACKALSGAGLWRDALHVLLRARNNRFVSDGLSYTTGITACGRGMRWQRSAQLLQDFQQSHGQNIQRSIPVITCNAAVTALSSGMGSQDVSRWQLALSLSLQTQDFDAVSHAIAIAVLDKASRWQWALLQFAPRNFHQQLNASRTGIYNAAINACKSGSQWGLSVALFEEVSQVKADAISCGSTISACVRGPKRKGWQIAFTFLDPLPPLPGTNIAAKHQVAYSAALAACEDGLWLFALGLLSDLQENSKVDLIACHSAIAACGKGFRWQEATEVPMLLHRLPRLSLTATTLNSVMAAYDRSSQWQHPLLLLTKMRGMRLQPVAISYNSVISSLAECGCWKIATDLFTMYGTSRLQLDVITFSGSTSACVRGGQWELAVMFFEQCDHAVKKNVISSNAAISACHQVAMWQMGLLQLEAMQHPTTISLNTAISACGKVLKWNEPLALLGHVLSRKGEVDQITYNASIEATSAAKQWCRTMLLLSQLTGFKPLFGTFGTFGTDVSPWSFFAAISACAKSTQWEWALFILDQAEKLHGSQLLDGYEAVLNAFSRVGAWQHSLHLLARLSSQSLPANTLCHKALVEVLEKSHRPYVAAQYVAEVQTQSEMALQRICT